ncbi:hypothetical protein C0995_013942 [Termitomyces sp. Mi166|nr:hypothetical protein C0995_013942 [Termitomyces sp. Mi166\
MQLQGQQPIQLDYRQQRSYVKSASYPGWQELLPYQSPYYSGGFGEGAAYRLQTGYRNEDSEGRYGHPIQQHTYVSVVMQPALPPRPLRQEHAPYMQPVNEVLLQHLERAGQPVPAMAAFLQNSLAIVVLEGLLNQIEMMKRQRITTLEHIEHAGKRKAPAYEELMVEPKQARAPARQPQNQEPDILAVVENPLAKLSLEPCNKIMTDAPAMQQEQRVEAPHVPVMSSQAGPSSQREAHLAPEIPELKAQPAAVESHRLSTSLYAPDVSGPTKHRPAQIAFHARCVNTGTPSPVCSGRTDHRPQDAGAVRWGLVATQQKTAAMSKGKGKAVTMVNDESDYGQSSSEDKQKSEQGESAAQRFQRMQQNKKLALKKANVAKARDAQQNQAINDFSGHILNGLGVKVWGPHDVEWLNSCFQGALGLYYYIGMDPNRVHLWKCMAAHSTLPSVPTATNIALTELSMVDAMVVSGPSTPPRTKVAPHESATNIAIGNVAMTLELGEVLEGNAGCEP